MIETTFDILLNDLSYYIHSFSHISQNDTPLTNSYFTYIRISMQVTLRIAST